jgi:YD repeat-containing protein
VRRRRWSAEEKGRIVADAVSPGAVIAGVARRHDLTPQHLSNWIRAAKAGRIVLPAEREPDFVPIIAAGQGNKRDVKYISRIFARLPYRGEMNFMSRNFRIYLDRDGRRWSYTHDADRRLTTIANPMGDQV